MSLIKRIYQAQYNTNYKIPGPFGYRYITYADYIASGQPLKFIEKFITRNILPSYANTHTEASYTGLQSGRYREEAREIIKKSVNAGEDDLVIFTGSGSTGAIDLMFRKLQQFYRDKAQKPVVFLGPFEHHSNILPWRESACEVVEIPLSSDGNVDLHTLEEQLKIYSNTRPLIGSFSAASNVTGIKAPVDEIHALLKKYKALSFWDYAGGAPYLPIDMNPAGGEGKDAVFISPHKLIGGPGTPGVLVAKKSLFESGLPVVVGGGTVHFVTKTMQRYFENIEVREEGGTPAIIESIRAGLAFRLKDVVGSHRIEEIESRYIQKALKAFAKHPKISVLGDLNQPRLGFLAFNIRYQERYLHHNFVVALLNDLFGIQARGGCSCAGPYGHDLLELKEEKSREYIVELDTGNVGIKPGWVRLNFNYFIPEEELEYLIQSIIWISENGWKLLNAYEFDDSRGLWKSKSQKQIPILRIADFMATKSGLRKGNAVGRKVMRKRYLKLADKIANQAVEKYGFQNKQSYTHNQVENPLRWYALSQDIS